MSQEVWILVETLRNEVLDISYTLLSAGRVLADGLGGKLIALLFGYNAEKLAGTLGAADRVVYVDHPALADFTPTVYQEMLSHLARPVAPRCLLLGHTSMGMDLACGISLDLQAALVTSCRTVAIKNGQPWYTSLICGGKIVAEGEMPPPTTVITMLPGGHKPVMDTRSPNVTVVPPPVIRDDRRVQLKGYIEPATGDVDITKIPLLVSVGRGIQQKENLKLAEELAAVLGGAVSASRPIVDQGWLPISRLVGKSGKRVKPKLYLAMGISGAPEHTEAIADADLIVAINTDEKAPIFDLAHFGATVDAVKLLPLLTAKVKQTKGG